MQTNRFYRFKKLFLFCLCTLPPPMTIDQYIADLNKEYKTGRATEHTYRGYLQHLIKSIVPDVMVTNEPQRIQCGAPDYIITKRDIPVGYIEAKDIGYKLDDKQYKEQFDRYRKSLGNLLITDYIDFWLYIDGELVRTLRIANVTNGSLTPVAENHTAFTNLIKDFSTHVGQTIKSPKKLAEMMAGKARMLSEVIAKALTSDEENHQNSTLKDQMQAFKQFLIHDITPQGFADVYAQTIAYGMFAARLHDPTLPTFSRQEAATLIPKSNPFLRNLFGYIAGIDVDDRIKWIVDGLAEVFLACNVEELLKNYGKATKMEDPIIHFYETFLSEYDPALRKARGVWYTPQPVVDFIVRAVDDILKTEFALPQGLADTSKTKIKKKVPKFDERSKDKSVQIGETTIEEEVHRVQILDPATGTGTFLAEVVKHIHKKFTGQQGIWSNYVEQHLIPRLNGFELLMASYAMAHLKMDLLLTETGYKPTKEQRLRVYLTNSLEENHPDTGTLFANWLSNEANEANHIKRDTPVMVVLGNPPYSISSTNKSEWIQDLISDYKKGLNEKKTNLDDDYIKFIRYGQHFIDKNGSGVLAYISNNSFIDGITHRQMRKNLVSTFDSIYIIDLHGNASKKEKHPNGGVDENVFDIQQGVSINIFVKSQNTVKTIKHFDLFGKREFKYDFLKTHTLSNVEWSSVKSDDENCFFTAKDLLKDNNYLKYISVADIFKLSNSGIQTKCDNISINEDVLELKKTVGLFKSESIDTLKSIFKREESSGWNFKNAKADLMNNSSIVYAKYNYRPFDFRYVVYTGTSSGFLGRSRSVVMKHFINKSNLGVCLMRQFFQDAPYSHVYATNSLIDERTMYSNRGGTYLFPLYIYPETKEQQTLHQSSERTPNLNADIVKQIAAKLKLKFTNEKETTKGTFAPIDVLDYIYAVLHSPAYREKYKEFLKIDFPRVPYPTGADSFWQLVKLGGQLRQLHLLESDTVEHYITQYPITGNNVVDKIRFEENYELLDGEVITHAEPVYPFGRVYINGTQFFQQVPKAAWEFYIGGYQPAQKWLKDRKGRTLTFEDILHYQKMIVALFETGKIMEQIDGVMEL